MHYGNRKSGQKSERKITLAKQSFMNELNEVTKTRWQLKEEKKRREEEEAKRQRKEYLKKTDDTANEIYTSIKSAIIDKAKNGEYVVKGRVKTISVEHIIGRYSDYNRYSCDRDFFVVDHKEKTGDLFFRGRFEHKDSYIIQESAFAKAVYEKVRAKCRDYDAIQCDRYIKVAVYGKTPPRYYGGLPGKGVLYTRTSTEPKFTLDTDWNETIAIYYVITATVNY